MLVMADLETRIREAMTAGPSARVVLAADFAATLPPPRNKREPHAPSLTAAWPTPLRDFFHVVGEASLGQQDRILAPNKVKLVDGKLLFAMENQGVCEWSSDTTDGDPTVYVRFPPPRAWISEEIPLSAFLLRFMVFEHILSLEHLICAACLPSAALAEVVDKMRLLPFPPARWPQHPSLHYARGDALAFASPNGEGVHTVWVGGRTAEDLTFLEPLSNDWEIEQL